MPTPPEEGAPKRGGLRPGSGRPVGQGNGTNPEVRCRISPEVKTWVESQPGGLHALVMAAYEARTE